MYGEGEAFKESTARTDKLFCSDCECKIKKGDKVTFRFDLVNEKMLDAYCEKCGEQYAIAVASERYPMDLED